jgi:hypothetical protein
VTIRRKTDAEVLAEVEKHLRRAEDELAIAIAHFGPRCGGYRFLIGSWADYKKSIGLLLKLRHFTGRIARAKQRSEQHEEAA